MNIQISRFLLTAIVLPFLLPAFTVFGQTGIIDKYIEIGINNNIALQQKNIDIEKAWYSLKTAESFFLPTVSFQGIYQTGVGGRSISLPIGDLMNPVYTTLNHLIGSEKFLPIKNVEQDFIAQNFYDAKIRTLLPIINSNVKYNVEIEKQKFLIGKLEIDSYRLELVKNIKVAYYTYLATLKIVEIHESTLQLVNENLRSNERLLQSGKGVPSYLLRIKAEQDNITSKITEAKKDVENAILYFNFLLNRDSKTLIEIEPNLAKELDNAIALTVFKPDISKRPELEALSEFIKLQRTIVTMNEKYWVPKLNGFLDIGSQASNFNFNTNSRYFNAGIQLDIPLFNGKRNIFKIKQAQLDKKNAELNLDYSSQQIVLKAETTYKNLISVCRNYQSDLKNTQSALSYQRLIERGFREGVNTFLEEIDARNLLVTAQLQVNISLYNVLSIAANLEREIGLLKN